MPPYLSLSFRKTDDSQNIWSLREQDLPPLARIALRMRKIFFIIVRSPYNRRISSQAAALSFTFLLSLVPLLAMIFSVAKGFGLQDKVEPMLLEKTLGGEIAAGLVPKILEYVDNTNVTALGSAGLLFMLSTSISLLGQIENAFNTIWLVATPRTFIRKATDYLALLILSPLLLAITVGMATTLNSHAILQKLLEIGVLAGAMKLLILALPWISSVFFLTLVLLILPNTRVKVLPALLAGIVAGVLWQLSQFLFITFQIGVARYNAIYGTFASLPIFMIWLQASWSIILFGGLISFACQRAATFHPLEFATHIPFAEQEKISLATLLAICRRFAKGEGPSAAAQISDELGISENFVAESLQRLVRINTILPVQNEAADLFVPAKPVQDLHVADYFLDIHETGKDTLLFKDREINTAVEEILAGRGRALQMGFAGRGMATTAGEEERQQIDGRESE
ncbi:MAG: YihY/virulence factor BrkB family protein [Thermodesulfobacteriota bacterium]